MKKLYGVLEMIYSIVYFCVGILAFPALYLMTLFMKSKVHYEESGYDY